MSYATAGEVFRAEIDAIKSAGTWKEERLIGSPQGVEIEVGGRTVLNFCANNYLGLSDHPAVLAAARRALDERGFGLSSVRFICGTQDRHRQLEQRLAAFFGVALGCHGEFAKDRPSTRHLTEYYLLMSFGGMLGGVFNGIFAPLAC